MFFLPGGLLSFLLAHRQQPGFERTRLPTSRRLAARRLAIKESKATEDMKSTLMAKGVFLPSIHHLHRAETKG